MIISNSKSGNYVTDDYKVFILDRFTSDTSNELIGNLSSMVYSLPVQQMYSLPATITNPYDLGNSDCKIIDVFINSPGGDTRILNSISTLLSIAKSRGAVIRTTVIGTASSCGSLLAIQGTPGFRIMYSKSYHFVHFGSHTRTITKADEIEPAFELMREATSSIMQLYTDHTKLTQRELDKITKNESGYLSADKCLRHGLCDWVIDDFGEFKQLADLPTLKKQKGR